MNANDVAVIAAALAAVRSSYAPHWDANLFRACDDHARRLADYLANVRGPRFDRAGFLNACGYATKPTT
jgi:hypothetical protein